MGGKIILLLLFLPLTCYADTKLEWDGPPGASGYRMYYGSSPLAPFLGVEALEGPSPVDVGNVTTTTIHLPTGAYYFTVTAYDSSGYESAYSNIVGTIGPPKGLRILSTKD